MEPTALFCCHDIRAYQVVTLCKELKIAVPREVAVMGVDNDRILCGFSGPMLTSVDPYAQKIGWAGARHLFDRMTGKRRGVEHSLVAPKRRIATKPTLGSQRRRIAAKTQRGEVKTLRGKVGDEE